jgi:hypothetical protein
MVYGQRRGAPVSGIFVVGLSALAGIQACGSRSPLDDRFVEGAGETGGSGGTIDTGGVGGRGGSNMTGGTGGAYPMGTGGSSPMGAGGAYPSAGYGGGPMSVGGAYPVAGTGGVGVGGAYPVAGYGGVGVGGAYPGAGYGGTGIGVGGAVATGGIGGKGNGGGGKGNGSVYKACFYTCSSYEAYCAGPDSTCLDDCVAVGLLYPNCSPELADYLNCLGQVFHPRGECDPESCSGPGCLTDAQIACQTHNEAFIKCASASPVCSSVSDVSETSCELTSFCGAETYFTYCEAIDATGTAFKCSCTSANSGASGTLTGRNLNEVCHEMAAVCSFPTGR